MKIVLKIAGAFSLAALAAAPGFAQSTGTASTTATTSIVSPISLAQTSPLVFGQVVKGAIAGTSTVTLTAAGSRSVSGGSAYLGATTGVAVAAYKVTGENGATFSIGAPGFNMSQGALTLAVTPLLSSSTGTLSGTGGAATATFTIGGSFPVDSTTTSGAYTGTMSVTVAYN